jgi:uncharacterized membrane protein YgcG
MKNNVKRGLFFGVLLTVFALAAVFVGCGSSSLGTAVYEGVDVVGNTYRLTITENRNSRTAYAGQAGDDYELVVRMKSDGTQRISRGTVREFNSADKRFTLQPSVNNSDTFNLVIDGGEIISVVGDIAISENEIFASHTFPTILLLATRWETNIAVGHHWGSGLLPSAIRLSDFFSGNLEKDTVYNIEVSGITDVRLERFGIDLHWETDDDIRENRVGEWLAGGRSDVVIEPGRFSVVLPVSINQDIRLVDRNRGNSQGGNSQGGNNQGGNSQGGNSQGGNNQSDIVIQVCNFIFHYHKIDEYYLHNLGRIPDDIEQGRTMAVISNFNIRHID